MPMEVGDLVNVTLRGTLYDQRIMTTYGFRVSATTSAGDTRVSQDKLALAISSDTGTNLMGTFRACVSPAVSINQIWVQRIRPIRMRKSVLNVALDGLLGSGPNTPNNAVVITRKSDFGGRNSISNLHLPGPPMGLDYVSNGTLTPAYKTLLDSHAFESYDTITVVNGGESVTYKGVIINAAGGPVNYQDITAHSIGETLRVMRRRTVGVGE